MTFAAWIDFSFHLNTYEAIVGLLIGLISILCVSGKREAQGEEGERWGNSRLVEQSEHTHLLSSPSYMGVVHGSPKQLQ